MTPTIGHWYRVTSGPHRGRKGVCDLVDERPNVTLYRIVNPQMIVGRFHADQLTPIANPSRAYVSQVSPETQQAALDVLMGRGR